MRIVHCPQGGIIVVMINWQCDLDVAPTNCKPTYSFRLLDTRKDLPTAGYYHRSLQSSLQATVTVLKGLT